MGGWVGCGFVFVFRALFIGSKRRKGGLCTATVVIGDGGRGGGDLVAALFGV